MDDRRKDRPDPGKKNPKGTAPNKYRHNAPTDYVENTYKRRKLRWKYTIR